MSVLASGDNHDLAGDAGDGAGLSLLGHLAFKVRAARKAGRAPGKAASVAACARRAVQRRRDCCVCCEMGLPKGGEEGLLLECGVIGYARMRGQRFLRF